MTSLGGSKRKRKGKPIWAPVLWPESFRGGNPCPLIASRPLEPEERRSCRHGEVPQYLQLSCEKLPFWVATQSGDRFNGSHTTFLGCLKTCAFFAAFSGVGLPRVVLMVPAAAGFPFAGAMCKQHRDSSRLQLFVVFMGAELVCLCF